MDLILSPPLLAEFREVLQRGKLQIARAYVDAFEEALLLVVTLVVPSARIEALQEDPEDNKVIECAVEGRANFIVSGDRHLLKLGAYAGIRIVRAPDLLRLLDRR